MAFTFGGLGIKGQVFDSTASNGPTAVLVPTASSTNVTRGGYYLEKPENCRVNSRYGINSTKSLYGGFQLAATPG